MISFENAKNDLEKIANDIEKDKKTLKSSVYFEKLQNHYIPTLKNRQKVLQEIEEGRNKQRNEELAKLKEKIKPVTHTNKHVGGPTTIVFGKRELTAENIQRWNYLSKIILSDLASAAEYGNFAEKLQYYSSSDDKNVQTALKDSFADVMRIKDRYIKLTSKRVEAEANAHGLDDTMVAVNRKNNVDNIEKQIKAVYDKLAESGKTQEEKDYEAAIAKYNPADGFRHSLAIDGYKNKENALQQELAFNKPDYYDGQDSKYFEGRR
jgi:hypothetical protein